jgi:hypothetical protein
VQTGELTGWDGRNLLAYRNGGYLDEQLAPRDATLQFWITAASFRTLGITTWAGRIPSVLMGLLALGLVGWILRRTLALSNSHALFAFGLMALSVVFLLNIRQCRYYALSLLSCLVLYHAHRRFVKLPRVATLAYCIGAAALVFYSQYLIGACFIIAIGLVQILFHREALRQVGWPRVSLAFGAFGAAIVPFAFSHKIWVRPDLTATEPSSAGWVGEFFVRLGWNLRDVNEMGIFPWLLTLPLLWLVWRRRREEITRTVILPWLVLAVAFVVLIAGLSPTRPGPNVASDARYLLPILPFACCLLGWMLAWWQSRIGTLAVMAVVALASATNLCSVIPPQLELRWRLPAYVYELAHDFPTGYRVTSGFLDQHGGTNDVVAVFPDFCTYPLMFYTGDRIRFGCLLNNTTQLPREKLAALAAPLAQEDNFPDWLILFGGQPTGADFGRFLCRPHYHEGQLRRFTYRFVTNLHTFWFDTSRPEWSLHTFGPRTNFDANSESIFIYKRSPTLPEPQ